MPLKLTEAFIFSILLEKKIKQNYFRTWHENEHNSELSNHPCPPSLRTSDIKRTPERTNVINNCDIQYCRYIVPNLTLRVILKGFIYQIKI